MYNIDLANVKSIVADIVAKHNVENVAFVGCGASKAYSATHQELSSTHGQRPSALDKTHGSFTSHPNQLSNSWNRGQNASGRRKN